ncbi:MAG: hypothetical protein QOF41_2373 [Methylobacteriaceae bacterium]|nr:hypothetical protein [Methylobacteriaceae bacterium]
MGFCRFTPAAAAILSSLSFSAVGNCQPAPSMRTQQGALDSVVYVEAQQCPDNQGRAGTGFTFENAREIITAHHVVGGCSAVTVTYAQADAGGQRRFSAAVTRIYSSGDLAMLQVANPPAAPALKRTARPIDKTQAHVGLGFQNGELSADGIAVTFSPSQESRLNRFLPAEALQELTASGSLIDINRQVLRFNRALQPGMSGGPIINAAGEVVGIVAGGLKAGTVPASWGWPSDWIDNLRSSKEAANISVSTARTFYTLRDLSALSTAIQTGRTIRCGDLDFSYRGRRPYKEVVRGSDDQQRLQIILQFADSSDVDPLMFDVWAHAASGATALMPTGYEIRKESDLCVARSQRGPFTQLLWGRYAQALDIQSAAQAFESMMFSRVPNVTAWNWDQYLTKFPVDAFGQVNYLAGPSAQTRSDGLVFTRKGLVLGQTSQGLQGPVANSFETLAARNGSFMGVGTINHTMMTRFFECQATQWSGQDCNQVRANFREWLHFVLSTQLSTYPVI